MKGIKISFLILFCQVVSFSIMGQVKPTPKKKIYCNPLVAGQPTTKRLSMIYELQPMYSGNAKFPLATAPTDIPIEASPVHSVRLQYNQTLVAKQKLYVSFMAGYWLSSFNVTGNTNNTFANILGSDPFHSLMISSNLFKPLNEKNFLLFNATVEANGNSFKGFSGNNLLAGGAAIFGWKKGFKRMWGIGVFRGYRMGKVIHVPALLFNSSFNNKWGVDALLPARANFRYKSSPSLLWYLGYDLDGSQFALRSTSSNLNGMFFQRGEIRPKIGFEKQIKKNWAFTMNAGLRFNGRFDVSTDYLGKDLYVETKTKAGMFVNAGIHVINFVKKKK